MCVCMCDDDDDRGVGFWELDWIWEDGSCGGRVKEEIRRKRKEGKKKYGEM